MPATEVSQETNMLAAFSFFPGQKDFASLSAMNSAYYLSSRGFVFWSLLHSAGYIWHWCFKAFSGAYWHLFQCFLLCWAWILHQLSQLQTSQRSTKAFAGSDVRGGPSWSESWHCSVPSPPASGNRSNQPNLVLVMLFTVPSSNQGVFSSCSFQEFVHQRETLSDSQHCWWDATLILPLCRSIFCCGS